MSRSKTDDILIRALGQRRSELNAKIRDIQAAQLADLQTEFDATEAKLKEIDPAILTLAEEAQIAADAVKADASGDVIK